MLTDTRRGLPLLHLLLALAVVAVWGTNFVIIKQALVRLPPLLLGTLRFVFAVLQAAFALAIFCLVQAAPTSPTRIELTRIALTRIAPTRIAPTRIAPTRTG